MKYTNYTVICEPFTERHFIKSFAKKYKGAWEATFQIIKEEFKQIDLLLLRSMAEVIKNLKEIRIFKTEFKIAGTKESRHGSGNRCIVAVNDVKKEARVLLIYNKTDLSGINETAEWQGIIKDNYPEYKNIF